MGRGDAVSTDVCRFTEFRGGYTPVSMSFVREGSTTMVRQEGSRWDVGTKDNVITLERFSEDDERVSEDVLEVKEARDLAALLTKHADKIESSDKDDSSDDDDSDKDDSSDDDDSDKDDSSDDDDSDKDDE